MIWIDGSCACLLGRRVVGSDLLFQSLMNLRIDLQERFQPQPLLCDKIERRE